MMERQLDPAAGYLLQKALERARHQGHHQGQHQGASSANDKVEGVELDDGRVIPADLVVMAVGIRPNAAAGQGRRPRGQSRHRRRRRHADLRSRHLRARRMRRASTAAATASSRRSTKWPRSLADQLAGDAAPASPASVTATKLKVTGIDLFSAGDFAEGEDREEIVLRDAAAGVYKRLVLKDNRIIGAVLYGETADGAWFFDLMKTQTDISEMRDTLIFGQAYQGGAPLDPTAAVAALPDDAEICGCNGVCKGKITGAITGQGPDDARRRARPHQGVGLLRLLHRPGRAADAADAGRRLQPGRRAADVRLHRSRPRRRAPPDRGQGAEDHPRRHAGAGMEDLLRLRQVPPGAQLLPRLRLARTNMPTTTSRASSTSASTPTSRRTAPIRSCRACGAASPSPKELRAIADVVDKFDIPTVKVTGGQRIDMLGVKKEDLPAVWADLGKAGLVSGHAYAKGLRTVKTCVGSDWCRFGTQDSTGLGITLEKFMWGSWTPAKVKMAVSGCPRNCAEATCKDVGVICVDCGYEIHFAGAAGLDIKGTEVLGHGEDRGRGAREHRRAGPDLPRAGPLSRTHLQMGQAHRLRRDPPPDRRRSRASARPISTASSSPRNSPRSIPGRSACPARTSTSSQPMAELGMLEAAE